MAATAIPTRSAAPWGYLAREATLILIWAYIVLVAGTVNGLISFRVQAISAVVTTAVLGLWLSARLVQRRSLPRTGLEWASLVFLLAQWTTTLLSQDVRRSLPLAAQTIAYVLIFYCAFDLTRAHWPAELTEKTLLIVGGIAVGLAWLDLTQAYLNWLALTAGQTYAPDFQYRSYAVLGDANLLSSFLNVLIPVALARTGLTKVWLNRIFLGVLIVSDLVIQVFTSSRGGAAGLAVSLGTLALAWVIIVSPSARERVRRAWAWLRARPLALAGLGVIAIAGIGFVAYRVLSFQGSATQGPALNARSEFWGPALEAFQRSPLWGSGPGTFPTNFILANSVPPKRPFLHAHSVVFNTLAEAGLLGLTALLIAVGALAWALWRARSHPSLELRARLAAVAAMWAGFITHSQVDDHTRYVAVALPLGIMLASVLAEAQSSDSDAPRARSLHPLWLALPGLLVAAFTTYSLRAYAISEQAVDAGNAGDWETAARLFDQAAEADPALVFYWEQAGYAHGQLAAQNDHEALDKGIARLERAIALQPNYAVTHANLAVLYRQAGRMDQAAGEIHRATRLAPAAAQFWLNRGVVEGALNQPDAARQAYRQALDLAPLQARSSFWAQTPLRQAALAEWRASAELGIDQTLADKVQQSIAAGDADTVERELLALLEADRPGVMVYVALAELAKARGDLPAAERLMQNAFGVQTLAINEQVYALLYSAKLAQAMGKTETAIGSYEFVLEAVSHYNIYGWGTAGWTPYAYFVFQRRALPVETLPQLWQADFTPDLGQSLIELGKIYEERGEVEEAMRVYQKLLDADPGLNEARERLTQLSNQ